MTTETSSPADAEPALWEDREKLSLLAACLRLDADASAVAGLGGAIAAVGWNVFLAYADRLRLTSVLVRAVVRRGLAPPVPAIRLPDGRSTITAALLEREAEHTARRAAMTERLTEAAAALNRAGLTPTVLKGGTSIVTGTPDWRSLRDIDLLVPGRQADEAQAVLLGLGCRPRLDRARWAHHHMPELYRDDLPGWIEIHRKAGKSRAEQFLPTSELVAAAAQPPDARVAGIAVLPTHLQVLHAMLHHHVGHRAVKQARMDLKGLYEFAAAVEAMTPDQCDRLWARASRHPRVLAILDLWWAAAVELFGLSVSPPAAAPDMTERWRRLRDGTAPTGLGAELQASRDPARLRRASGGSNPLRRLWWQVTVPLTFLDRPTIDPAALLREIRQRNGG